MSNQPSPLERELAALMRRAAKDRILDEDQVLLLAQDLIAEFNRSPLDASEIYQATYLRDRILYEQDPAAAPRFKEAYNTLMKGLSKRLRDHGNPENQTGIIKVGMYNRAKARIGLTKPIWDSREDAARESTALFESLYQGMGFLYAKVFEKMGKTLVILSSPFARIDVEAFEKAQLGPDFTQTMGKLTALVKLLRPGALRHNHLLFEILRRHLAGQDIPREYLAWAFIGRDELFGGLVSLARQAMLKTGKNEELKPEDQARRAEPLAKALEALPCAGDQAQAYQDFLSGILGRRVAPPPPEALEAVQIPTGDLSLEALLAEFAPAREEAPGPSAPAARPRSGPAQPQGDDMLRTRGFHCGGKPVYPFDPSKVAAFSHVDSLRKLPKATTLVDELSGLARSYNDLYREIWTTGSKDFTVGKHRLARILSLRSAMVSRLLDIARQAFGPAAPLSVVDRPRTLQAMAGVLESLGEDGPDFDAVRNVLAKHFIPVRRLHMPPDLDLRPVKDEPLEEPGEAAGPAPGPGPARPARTVLPSEVEACFGTEEGTWALLKYLLHTHHYQRAKERLDGMDSNWRSGVAPAADLLRTFQELNDMLLSEVRGLAEAEQALTTAGLLNQRLLFHLKDPVQQAYVLQRLAQNPKHAEAVRALEE